MPGKQRSACITIAVLFIGASLPMHAADLKVRAGGLDLTLPLPENFEDVGEKYRTTLFELMVPSSNRLVAALAPPAEIAKMNEGKASGGLDAYAMIQAPRQMEYADCTPEAFQQVLKSVGAPIGEVVREQISDEMNVRLKSLGQGSIDVGGTKDLGAVFRKTDAYGSVTLTKYSQGERSGTMAAGTALIRVRQRVIFAYIFRRYESPETVLSIGKSLEAWTDLILAKNR